MTEQITEVKMDWTSWLFGLWCERESEVKASNCIITSGALPGRTVTSKKTHTAVSNKSPYELT